jgi:hypothetical protein
MSKSYPYNAILTRDSAVVDKLFFDELTGVKSFNSRLKSLTSEQVKNSLIISPKTNKDFISLDVSIAEGRGTRYVVLKVIESNEMLEFFGVTKNGYEESLLNKIKINSAVASGGKNNPLQFLRNVARPRFFLSFGIGDRLKDWSGPYSLELIDVNITITSDGVREAEFMFTPAIESLSVFTNKAYDDITYSQSHSIFDAKNLEKEKFLAQSYHFIKDEYTPEEGWNYCIRYILTEFISKKFTSIPRGNCMVLLPDDFTKIQNHPLPNKNGPPPTFQTANAVWLKGIGIELINLNNEGVNQSALSEDLPYATDPEKQRIIKTLSAASIRLKKIREELLLEKDENARKITYLNGLRVEPTGELKKLIAEQKIINKRIDDVNIELNAIDNGTKMLKPKPVEFTGELNSRLLRAFALDLFPAPGEESGKTARQAYEEEFQVRLSVVIPLRNPDKTRESSKQIGNSKKTGKFKPLFRLDMGENYKFDHPDKNKSENILLSLKPLYDFVNGMEYKSEGSKYPHDFTIVEEHNVIVLNNLFQAGLIEDDKKPAVIFGRKSYINNLLYPSYKESVNTPFTDSSLTLVPNDAIVFDDNDPRRKIRESLALAQDNPETSIIKNLDRAARDKGFMRAIARAELWGSYKRRYVDYYNEETLRGYKTSSFNELPGDSVLNLLDNYYGQGDPDGRVPLVFTYNTRNANVLKLSFDSSPYKASFLDYSSESTYNLLDQAFDIEEVISDDSLYTDSLGKLITFLANELNKARGEYNYNDDVIDSLKTALRSKGAQMYLGSLDYFTEPETSKIKPTDTATFLQAVLIRAAFKSGKLKVNAPGKNFLNEFNILRKINKYVIDVNLKTLPFFNLQSSLGRPCILHGNSNYVVGSKISERIRSHDDYNGGSESFFNGNYMMVEVKHHMDPTNSYSEFKLANSDYGTNTSLTSPVWTELFSEALKAAREVLEKDKKLAAKLETLSNSKDAKRGNKKAQSSREAAERGNGGGK